ncbi:MAG: hypothetical protein U0Q12_06465 [Vicinamibacterales bacterium]
MTCLVCHATFEATPQEGRCPQCGYDANDPAARDVSTIMQARTAFRERTTAFNPSGRVSAWDVARPWVGLGLGALLFVFWLRACSTGGWRLW